MSLTYSSYVSQLATITVISSTILETGDNNFGGIIPGAIDYAEGRLYRDLDLPVARVTDTSVICSSGVRSILLSTTVGTILEVEDINLFSSAGTTSSNATRIPQMPVSQAVVDAIYPSALSSNCGLPQYFARVSDVEVIFGPTPDQAYGTEVTAVIRPAPLSANNSTTWLCSNVPEMMIAASMVFLAGYMRDFGSQSDNPQMGTSWETQYQALLKTMDVDSLRQKFQSVAWGSNIPSAVATPPRV